jgi:calcineurin-like phosphoesterase family protein
MVQKVQKWVYIHHDNHFSEASTTKMDVNALQVEKMTVENWLATIQDESAVLELPSELNTTWL